MGGNVDVGNTVRDETGVVDRSCTIEDIGLVIQLGFLVGIWTFPKDHRERSFVNHVENDLEASRPEAGRPGGKGAGWWKGVGWEESSRWPGGGR